MKTKYLLQALRFACLPTLSVLVLLFFGFFSISKTIDFISSSSVMAVIIRVVLVLSEFALIWVMYNHYKKQDFEKDTESPLAFSKEKYNYRKYNSIENCFSDSKDNYERVSVHKTANPNIVVVKKIIK